MNLTNLTKKNLLECIYCSSKKITKSIMSPMVSLVKEKKNSDIIIDKTFQSEKKQLINLRKYIEKNFEYVGKDFSKKVREIYYDDKRKNNLRHYNSKRERRIRRGRNRLDKYSLDQQR